MLSRGKNVAQKEADVENTAETVTVVEGSLPEEAIAPECSEPRYAAIEKLVREAGQKMLKARPGEENIHKKRDLQISARIMIQRSRDF